MTTIGWHERLTDHQRHLVRELISAATQSDGIAPVGDQVLRELSHTRTRHLLATEGDAVLGYLNLAPAADDAPAMAELVVHPDARRRGIGSSMIGTGLPAGGDDTRIWAHGNLAPARATAEALDLAVVRELWQMRRSLADLPPTPAPAGATITTYSGPADDAELLRANNAAFVWHPEQGGWTADDIAERRAESWFDPEGLFLARDEATGDLLGFHWTKTHSDTLGEVYVVGVDPSAQGRGLGATLTLVGLHHLAGRLTPPAEVMLYVESDNTAAVKTYRRLGFEVATVDAAYSRRTADHL